MITEMPLWALTLTYWLHLLATIVWLGGLAMLALIIWPLAADALTLLERIERRFRPFVNGSLALLFITGMVQMTADANYSGLLVIDSVWAAALAIKHVIFGGMLLLSVWIQVNTLPGIERAQLLKDEAGVTKGFNQLRRLISLDLGAGVLVLLMTALMTAV